MDDAENDAQRIFVIRRHLLVKNGDLYLKNFDEKSASPWIGAAIW